ncbi:MAG: GNAT family N-acetyltransferase [Christensenellaceae bacterium]|jgi:ribosomal protein S18 acetylase RimI-like enzyme|nr:GNAT family N-acetyltransferase [Christensenellaceae bacterium]
MALEIRAPLERELFDLPNLYLRCWQSTYRGIFPQNYLDSLTQGDMQEEYLGEENAPNTKVLVALDDGKMAGVSTYGPPREEMPPGYGELKSIYLLPEHRGKGIGQALLHRVLQALRNEGYFWAFLYVLEENRGARRFYEREGFCAKGERHLFEIEGERLFDLTYETKL